MRHATLAILKLLIHKIIAMENGQESCLMQMATRLERPALPLVVVAILRFISPATITCSLFRQCGDSVLLTITDNSDTSCTASYLLGPACCPWEINGIEAETLIA